MSCTVASHCRRPHASLAAAAGWLGERARHAAAAADVPAWRCRRAGQQPPRRGRHLGVCRGSAAERSAAGQRLRRRHGRCHALCRGRRCDATAPAGGAGGGAGGPWGRRPRQRALGCPQPGQPDRPVWWRPVAPAAAGRAAESSQLPLPPAGEACARAQKAQCRRDLRSRVGQHLSSQCRSNSTLLPPTSSKEPLLANLPTANLPRCHPHPAPPRAC